VAREQKAKELHRESAPSARAEKVRAIPQRAEQVSAGASQTAWNPTPTRQVAPEVAATRQEVRQAAPEVAAARQENQMGRTAPKESERAGHSSPTHPLES